MPDNNVELDQMLDLLEDLGFSANYEGKDEETSEETVRMSKRTPARETWIFYIGFDGDGNFVEEFLNYANTFDYMDEQSIWFEFSGRKGVPDKETLIEDGKWKAEQLKIAATRLAALYYQKPSSFLVEKATDAAFKDLETVQEIFDNIISRNTALGLDKTESEKVFSKIKKNLNRMIVNYYQTEKTHELISAR